jgi:hypothetical protein
MDAPWKSATQDESTTRLRSALQALKPPEVANRSAAPVSSVFGRAAAAVPSDVHPAVARSTVNARMSGVVASALLPGTTLVLVVAPDPVAQSEAAAQGERLLASGAVVVMLGPDLARQVEDRSRVLTIPLRTDDSLSQEWALITCGPARRMAVLAQREADREDAWCWLSTQDTVAVHRAGTAILERVPFLRLFVPALADEHRVPIQPLRP